MRPDGEPRAGRSAGRTGLLSRRLPRDFEPNDLARGLAARQRSRVPILDLAETNPTRVGLPTLEPELLAALAPESLASYDPDARGLRSAREAVAAYLAGRTAGVGVSPDGIVLTSGTSESYAHLLRVLCDPGDAVLAPRPSYPLFAPLADAEGVEIRTYRLAYDGTRWRVDLDSLEAALGRGARAVIVVEPNNPTGSCLAPGEIAALESLCGRHGAVIVSDEVFGDFPWPPRHGPLPGLMDGRSVPTFVLGGISKLCGLPQLKLGWIAAAGPEAACREVMTGLEWMADLFLTVGSAVQLALPRLLEARHAFGAGAADRLRANLETLDGVAAVSGAFQRLNGDGGWSAVIRAAGEAAREPGGLPALAKGVHAHPGHFYDLPDDRHAVVSLLPRREVFRAGIERIAAHLRE